MAPILYYNEMSPASRAALLVVRNLGVDVEVKFIDTFKGEQHSPEYLKINPLHQVPVYVEGDFVLTESRAIALFLANSVKSKFYPTDLKARALVDSRLFFDATNSIPTVIGFVRPVLRTGVKKVSQDRREAVKVLLNTFESFLEKSEWFAGDELTIADFAILASVTTIKAWGASFAELPRLNDWYNRCKAFPGFPENLEGAQILAGRLAKILDEPLWI